MGHHYHLHHGEQQQTVAPHTPYGAYPDPIGLSLHPLTRHRNETATFENLWLPAVDGHVAGVLLEALLLAFSFTGLAITCDEYLVLSLEVLALRWNVREDVAGASFLAFGSASPEIVINAVSTFKQARNAGSSTDHGSTNLGTGAIVGSGVIAFSLVPACCAL